MVCFLWSKNPSMKLNELTEKIIGAAHKVLFVLKPGLDEKLSERALVIELTKQGMRCASPRSFDVYYDEQHISTLTPDLIVDTKVVAAFNDTHLRRCSATSISRA
jgi:GxxExxY protein